MDTGFKQEEEEGLIICNLPPPTLSRLFFVRTPGARKEQNLFKVDFNKWNKKPKGLKGSFNQVKKDKKLEYNVVRYNINSNKKNKPL